MIWLKSRVILFLLAPLTVAGPSVAQHHEAVVEPQVLASVDGAENPAAIPDVVAYRHFFNVLSSKPGSTPEADEARRTSYLNFFFGPGCGDRGSPNRSLSETQMSGLLSVVADLETRLRPIEDQMRALKGRSGPDQTGQPPVETVVLRQQRDEAVANAALSIAEKVDEDAAAKVRAHVLEHVKAHIKMVTVRIPMP